MISLLQPIILLITFYGCEAVINQISQKIVNGQNAEFGTVKGHPYIVSMQYLHHTDEEGDHYKPFCGGMIVDKRTILTAAHCFEESKPNCWVDNPDRCYRVVAGAYDLSRNVKEQMRIVPMDRIKIHEDYDGFHYDNDIAMIRLRTPLHFNEYVKAIPLVKEGGRYSSRATIAGWGETYVASPDRNVLQEANVTIYSDSECESRWGQYYHSEVMICAGNQLLPHQLDGIVPDACNGDSGGPLITRDLDDLDPSTRYLIGITSYGFYECGNEIFPGVYTKVEAFLEWINKNRLRSRKKGPRAKFYARHNHFN